MVSSTRKNILKSPSQVLIFRNVINKLLSLSVSSKTWCYRWYWISFQFIFTDDFDIRLCFFFFFFTINRFFLSFLFFLWGQLSRRSWRFKGNQGDICRSAGGKSVRVRARRAREHGPSRTSSHVASLCRRLAPPFSISPPTMNQERSFSPIERKLIPPTTLSVVCSTRQS